MGYLFTSESVSEGHPDKVADQISDAVLDKLLAYDDQSHVACETLVTTGQVVIAGEISSDAYIDIPLVARETIRRIGYTKSEYCFDAESCGVLNAVHEQSPDINRGVAREVKEEQGAGDQGMMFGYATNETRNYMPLPLDLAQRIMKVLADIRKEGREMTYLRPDSKSQVTVEYSDEGRPIHIDTVVVSTQHDEFLDAADFGNDQLVTDKAMQQQIYEDVKNILMPRVLQAVDDEQISSLFDENTRYLVNPTGKFVIGGPHGDTGLTGRKIIVDTYGGRGAHGGGAFSGKDPSKVDRSAAYMARYIAKNIVAADLADKAEVELAYAIGVPFPVSIMVETFGTEKVPVSKIENAVKKVFDCTPSGIASTLNLKQPIYQATASYGHFGRTEFPWEKTDKIEELKQAIN